MLPTAINRDIWRTWRPESGVLSWFLSSRGAERGAKLRVRGVRRSRTTGDTENCFECSANEVLFHTHSDLRICGISWFLWILVDKFNLFLGFMLKTGPKPSWEISSWPRFVSGLNYETAKKVSIFAQNDVVLGEKRGQNRGRIATRPPGWKSGMEIYLIIKWVEWVESNEMNKMKKSNEWNESNEKSKTNEMSENRFWNLIGWKNRFRIFRIEWNEKSKSVIAPDFLGIIGSKYSCDL